MVTEKAYARIISLAPSITETLFAISCGEKLVGRTEFCDWPKEAETVPIIGGFNSVDVQSILKQQPDMVIGTSLHKDILEKVKNTGINVAIIPPYPVYGAPLAIRSIAHAINAIPDGDIVAQEAENKIAPIKQKASSFAPQRVCYFCNVSCPAWCTCLIAASVEFLNCSLAGRKPPSGQNSDTVVTNIIADAPDVFVIPECQKCRKECIDLLLTSNAKLKEYNSLRNPRIALIGSKLLGRAGPRAAQALDELGKVIFNNLWKMGVV